MLAVALLTALQPAPRIEPQRQAAKTAYEQTDRQLTRRFHASLGVAGGGTLVLAGGFALLTVGVNKHLEECFIDRTCPHNDTERAGVAVLSVGAAAALGGTIAALVVGLKRRKHRVHGGWLHSFFTGGRTGPKFNTGSLTIRF